MDLYERKLANKLEAYYKNNENFTTFVSVKGKCKSGKNIALSRLYSNLTVLRYSNIALDGLYMDFYGQFEKDYFDIFSRGPRVLLNRKTREITTVEGNNFDSATHIETTLSQLNFFFFLIKNNLLRQLIVPALKYPARRQELLFVFQPSFLCISTTT
jgi:hypothetical protein